MNVKNGIKSTLASIVILSIPALSTTAHALDSTILPGSSCQAYYAGQQSSVNLYSGSIYAKSTVRVICPLTRHYQSNDMENYISLKGYNASGNTPSCHIVETTNGAAKWTSLPILSGKHYFEIGKFIAYNPSKGVSISCVLSAGDSVRTTSIIPTYQYNP